MLDEPNISESDISIKCDGDQLGFSSEGSSSLQGVVCYNGMSPGSTATQPHPGVPSLKSPGCCGRVWTMDYGVEHQLLLLAEVRSRGP